MSGPRDWKEVRDRLQALAESQSQEKPLAALFEQRARLLALGGSAPVAARSTEYLMFELDARRYAVPLASLKAVESLQTLSAVPGSHPAIVGVTAQRNQVLPIVDLNLLVHPERDVPRRARFLWIVHKGIDVGLAADAILGMESVAEEALLRLSLGGSEVFAGLLEDAGFLDLGALLRLLGVDRA